MRRDAWSTTRLRHVVQLNPSPRKLARVRDGFEVSFMAMESLHENGTISLDVVRPIEDVRANYSVFEDGDVVLAKVTPCFENGKAALAARLVNGVAFGTTEITVLRPRERMHPKYLYYLTIEHAFRQGAIASMTGAGGLRRVPDRYVRDFAVALPPLGEQRQIAEYLDRETGQIVSLIAKQEQLIETLTERRQAVIAHAVIRGLDPDVETRDAQEAWIGRVPIHWLLGGVKHLGEVTLGKMIQPEQKEPNQVLAPYMRAANVQPDGHLALADVKEMWFGPKELAGLMLHAGDVVVVEGGMGGYGRAAYLKEDLQAWGFQNSINRVRVRSGDGRYLTYVLLAARSAGFITAVCAAVSMPHFTAEKLARFYVPLPPENEQKQIANYLDDATFKVDALIAKTREMTALLRERRQALISAAVTGKIDVREL